MQLDDLLARDDFAATFHDASVHRLTLDYVAREAVLECSICVGNPDAEDEQEREARRNGTLIFQGLLYCAIDPPDPRYPYSDRDGLWISDVGPLDLRPDSAKRFPVNLPAEAFAHYFFVNDWNAFIYIAARSARFDWTDKYERKRP